MKLTPSQTKALSTLGAKESAQARSIAVEVLVAAAAAGHEITCLWGYKAGGAEHGTGRAIDFMVYRDKKAGDWIAAYLWKHRARFALRHYIWQQAIRSTKVQPGKVRPMPDRGDSTQNHRDHVHTLFDAKAYRPLPAPKPPTTTPKPKPGKPILRRELAHVTPQMHGSDVAAVQKKLGVTADGYYGPATERAVYGFQSRWFADRNEWDGRVGPKTGAALGFRWAP